MLILGFCLYLLQTGHKFLSHSFYHTLSSAALNTVVFSPSLPSLLLFKCSLLVHGTEDRVEFLSSVLPPLKSGRQSSDLLNIYYVQTLDLLGFFI